MRAASWLCMHRCCQEFKRVISVPQGTSLCVYAYPWCILFICICFLCVVRAQIYSTQGDHKGFLVCRKKMATASASLCMSVSDPFRRFTDDVINLKFDQEPAYASYIAMFHPLLGEAILFAVSDTTAQGHTQYTVYAPNLASSGCFFLLSSICCFHVTHTHVASIPQGQPPPAPFP